jgi:hypothetical protein
LVGKYDSGKDEREVGAGADAFDFGELNEFSDEGLFEWSILCNIESFLDSGGCPVLH